MDKMILIGIIPINQNLSIGLGHFHYFNFDEHPSSHSHTHSRWKAITWTEYEICLPFQQKAG